MAEKIEKGASMKLIDTNIFVDHLRGYVPAIKFFEEIATQQDVIFSAITEAELISGQECNDTKKKECILQLLQNWEKIPVSNPIAIRAGDICRSHGIDLPDALIAATALINKAELVTKNVKDFHRVNGLNISVPY